MSPQFQEVGRSICLVADTKRASQRFALPLSVWAAKQTPCAV